jgi:hypothetical protein
MRMLAPAVDPARDRGDRDHCARPGYPLPWVSTVVPSTLKTWMPNQFTIQAKPSTSVFRNAGPRKIAAKGDDSCSMTPYCREFSRLGGTVG